ncbi:amidohydrolase [Myxococcus fulvus]|uniref:amidohydrolase n=1 Tax=Myxococcus fulvus TaxID=33 RepID=UPI003B98F047
MRRYSRWKSRCLGRLASGPVMGAAALALLSSCATTGRANPGAAAAVATVFLGKVLTMDEQGTVAQAVSVDARGRILKVGSEQEVMAGLGDGVATVRLGSEQVLMPGFIDPHMHFLPTMIQSVLGTHNLAPCLPPPYGEPAADCATRADLLSALSSMKLSPQVPEDSKEFVLGMNLDPSRQQFVPGGCGVSGDVPFTKQPKLYLDACVSKDRPVLILDQSGHLAYVNDKAIEVVCKGVKDCAPPPSVAAGGGEWAKDANGYTGLLKESAGYAPFMAAMTKSLPLGLVYTDPGQLISGFEKEVSRGIEALRAAGLTTIADGGLASVAQLQAVKHVAEREGFPLRITGVVTHDVATAKGLQPTGPACDPTKDADCTLPRWLGAGGIKLWVDGSTQGCTAWLEKPYHYENHGHCAGEGEGRADFDSVKAITDSLRPLWATSSWRFQLHANGNLANKWALEAFTQLQQEKVNPHRVLFIHNTVGQEPLSRDIGSLRQGTLKTSDGKTVPALDAHVTHLIGHVAYWGAVFEDILGEATARNIDPTGFDLRHGVPFSFHSDSMVTPARPLWFVAQAVSRRTWAYPDFQKSKVLGAEHRVSVAQALRAITVEPARQHELDGWLGTIEQGKVADFVVLGSNPLDFDQDPSKDPLDISKIKVIQTYINGKPTAASH